MTDTVPSLFIADASSSLSSFGFLMESIISFSSSMLCSVFGSTSFWACSLSSSHWYLWFASVFVSFFSCAVILSFYRVLILPIIMPWRNTFFIWWSFRTIILSIIILMFFTVLLLFLFIFIWCIPAFGVTQTSPWFYMTIFSSCARTP